LVVPKSWTDAIGVSDHTYHLMAVFLGTVAGFCTLIGLAILIARRRLTGPVFAAHHSQRQGDVRGAGGRDRPGLWRQ
jgi:nitrate reductase gamma subunit